MPWQSGLSCVSCLSSAHAFLMSAPSPDSVISSTSVGRQPFSSRALAAASSRLARFPPFNGVQIGCCCHRPFVDRHHKHAFAHLVQHMRHERRLAHAARADDDHVAAGSNDGFPHKRLERLLELGPLHVSTVLCRVAPVVRSPREKRRSCTTSTEPSAEPPTSATVRTTSLTLLKNPTRFGPPVGRCKWTTGIAEPVSVARRAAHGAKFRQKKTRRASLSRRTGKAGRCGAAGPKAFLSHRAGAACVCTKKNLAALAVVLFRGARGSAPPLRRRRPSNERARLAQSDQAVPGAGRGSQVARARRRLPLPALCSAGEDAQIFGRRASGSAAAPVCSAGAVCWREPGAVGAALASHDRPRLSPVYGTTARPPGAAPSARRADVCAAAGSGVSLQEAMRLRSTLPKADMGFIIGLMDELEADKAVLGELDDAGVQLENYGLDLFLRADDADRAGRSDLRTGKAFFAAAQVGERPALPIFPPYPAGPGSPP
eukprot:scaffold383_cov101-Isochrysis_galbana.AAC.1